ncbi:MAG: DUF4395 domain-containing protein [Corynebacterium variabile]|nr:DUF4395 domain-containing protein [Corynebacterium variabile]
MTSATAAHRSQIDVRAPRFGAAIMSLLLAVEIVLALIGATAAALILLAAIVAIFALGALDSPLHPGRALFRTIRPRLAPTTETEDAAPPRFAQLVGLIITGAGLILGLIGVGPAIPVAAALAFIATFLNAAIGLCLGCQIHGLLVRAGVIHRTAGA